MSTTPTEADKRAADKITGGYADYVGSGECGIVRDRIAAIIAEAHQSEREALNGSRDTMKRVLKYLRSPEDESAEMIERLMESALAAIEKVSG